VIKITDLSRIEELKESSKNVTSDMGVRNPSDIKLLVKDKSMDLNMKETEDYISRCLETEHQPLNDSEQLPAKRKSNIFSKR
jgi:hypothetical protein